MHRAKGIGSNSYEELKVDSLRLKQVSDILFVHFIVSLVACKCSLET